MVALKLHQIKLKEGEDRTLGNSLKYCRFFSKF